MKAWTGALFMAELTRIAGGAAAASLLLRASPPMRRRGRRSPRTTAASATRDGRVEAAAGPRAIAATTRAPRERPAACRSVLVIHENRGLNDHIRDVARRLARRRLFARSRPIS